MRVMAGRAGRSRVLCFWPCTMYYAVCMCGAARWFLPATPDLLRGQAAQRLARDWTPAAARFCIGTESAHFSRACRARRGGRGARPQQHYSMVMICPSSLSVYLLGLLAALHGVRAATTAARENACCTCFCSLFVCARVCAGVWVCARACVHAHARTSCQCVSVHVHFCACTYTVCVPVQCMCAWARVHVHACLCSVCVCAFAHVWMCAQRHTLAQSTETSFCTAHCVPGTHCLCCCLTLQCVLHPGTCSCQAFPACGNATAHLLVMVSRVA